MANFVDEIIFLWIILIWEFTMFKLDLHVPKGVRLLGTWVRFSSVDLEVMLRKLCQFKQKYSLTCIHLTTLLCCQSNEQFNKEVLFIKFKFDNLAILVLDSHHFTMDKKIMFIIHRWGNIYILRFLFWASLAGNRGSLSGSYSMYSALKVYSMGRALGLFRREATSPLVANAIP